MADRCGRNLRCVERAIEREALGSVKSVADTLCFVVVRRALAFCGN